MISNLRISVAELVVWALLAAAGLTWISFRVVDGAVWLMDWLRDRVTPLLEDDPFVLCDGCRNRDHCDGAVETCDCTCGWDEDWAEELPPERTWEQMTAHQLPLIQMPRLGTPIDPLRAERERRPPEYEAEHRAHYVAMGFEYPSGLMARVRELAP